MTKFEALIITGKLEVYVTGEKELFDEVKSMQKYLINDDFVNLAISCNRLAEHLAEHSASIKEKVGEYQEDFINYVETQVIDIRDLGLSVRAHNCLKRACIDTVGDILNLNGDKLCRVRNLGRKSTYEVIDMMEQHGFDEWACRIRKEILELRF